MARRRLIINADDLGYDPQVTAGILKAMDEGVVTSATFMVNTPFSEEAAGKSRGRALGLHLNLARWAPVSRGVPAEFLTDGHFDEGRTAAMPSAAVAAELRAQLDRFEKLLGKAATHVDVHKHLHQHPGVLGGVIEVARERKLPVRSINPVMRAALAEAGVATPEHFIGDAGRDAYWTLEKLRQHVESLEDGVTELMCHPGYSPSQVSSGYGAQREVELETFVHPGARTLLEKRGVKLLDFSAL